MPCRLGCGGSECSPYANAVGAAWAVGMLRCAMAARLVRLFAQWWLAACVMGVGLVCCVTFRPMLAGWRNGVRHINEKEASFGSLFVGILGLEPRMTGPESVVLPLHHIPMFASDLFPDCECKGIAFF